jgi:hypothetical protein
MSTLVLFGNENLQRHQDIVISTDGSRNTTGNVVVTQERARGDGVAVTNTRLASKPITINGTLIDGSSSTSLQDLIAQFDAIFDKKTSQYLRFMNNWQELNLSSSATGWAGSDDAASIATRTDKYQLNGTSLGFNIDVSASGNNYATLAYTGSQTIDLTSVQDTGNFEFWLYIPDAQYVTSVDFRIGNDSSNYYSKNFTTDYQGQSITNGVNFFSANWNPTGVSPVSETGTVNNASIDYCYIRINYSSSMEDVNGCYFQGVLWTDEDRTRNYPVYRDGEIQKEGNHYNNTFTGFTANFINHTGYAIGTHYIELFDETGITAINNKQLIDLLGGYSSLPEFTITLNTIGNMDTLSIANQKTQEQIDFDLGILADGDIVRFGGVTKTTSLNNVTVDYTSKIPEFDLGKQRVNLILRSSSTTTVEFDTTFTGSVNDPTMYYAQQFAAGVTGTLQSVYINLNVYSPSGANITLYIYSDNANTPNTLLATSDVINLGTVGSGFFGTDGLSLSVTNTTKYWVMVRQGLNNAFLSSINWRYATGYAGGIAKTSTDGTTWSASTAYDFLFRTITVATPTWDIDWSAQYKPLYLS